MLSRNLRKNFLFPRFLSASQNLNIKELDGRSSFYERPTTDVARGLLLLKLASYGSFVENAEKLYKTSTKVLGTKISEKLLEKTFYAQFVAGDSEKTIEAASKRLLKHGNVKTMLCPPMEDLEGEHTDFTQMTNENTEKFLNHLHMAKRLNETQIGQRTVMQYKLSATFPVECLEKFSHVVDQRKEGWEKATHMVLGALEKNGNDNFADFKFDERTVKDLQMGIVNTKKIFDTARELDIPILIDAELRSQHTAMYALTIALCGRYNKKVPKKLPLVFGTYQCYMKDTQKYLKESMALCDKLNVTFGAKLVRGAYMMMERSLAKRHGMDDPIWPTYDATSASYDAAVEFMLRQIQKSSESASVFIASHNQNSVQKAVELIQKLNISKENLAVKFAQIYGMCDHISFGLGNAGYTVYKSVPWGSVGEWVPYLARRAAENHTAFRTARNEIPLYRKELKRRLTGK